MGTMRSEWAGRPVIVGGGLAGLMTALRLAPRPVVLLARLPLGEGAASAWAQGGIAAAVGADDRPDLHAADTLAAGDGLADPAVAAAITASAPAAVARLEDLGVRFDRDEAGRPALGLEAAHGRRRIVHVQGDGSGAAIVRALAAAVRATPSITVLEGLEVRRLLTDSAGVAGVLAAGPKGACLLPTRRVVLATGGLGGLFLHTTNPLGAVGHGLALAARAGATLADLEFVQFHPTALDVGLDPMPLVSEAVRGEGAVLIDEAGDRFMAGCGRAELEPRDVVSRAVAHHLAEGHRVFLDARSTLGAGFERHFPTIAARCRAAGIDAGCQPIPVRPAAHYHMGGVVVDAEGRTDVPGLWACGEVASTGLHGANRLASNSLLEAVVGAEAVADSLSAIADEAMPRLRPSVLPPAPAALEVRSIASEALGVVRDRAGLEGAVERLQPLAFAAGPSADPALVGADGRHGRARARGKPRRPSSRRLPQTGPGLGPPPPAAGERHERPSRLPDRSRFHHPPTARRRSLNHAHALAPADDRGAGARRPARRPRTGGRPHDRCHRAGRPAGGDGAGRPSARNRGRARRRRSRLPPGRSGDRVPGASARWHAREGGRRHRHRRRPGPRHAHGRARGAELPRPSQRRRLGDGDAGRRGTRPQGPHLLHAQDDARAAGPAEVRRAGRRRRQSSLRPR